MRSFTLVILKLDQVAESKIFTDIFSFHTLNIKIKGLIIIIHLNNKIFVMFTLKNKKDTNSSSLTVFIRHFLKEKIIFFIAKYQMLQVVLSFLIDSNMKH